MGVVENSRQPHARRQCGAIHPFEAAGCGCDLSNQPLERRKGRTGTGHLWNLNRCRRNCFLKVVARVSRNSRDAGNTNRRP